MEKTKLDAFIKKLSKETLNNKIFWQYLIDLENVDSNSNPELYFLLFQTEYRQIDFYRSYYAPVNTGTIYVIYEIMESGRDGTLTKGYKIYITYDESKPISQLPCEQSNIYQLLNSIKSFISKKESSLESFIDDYLSETHQ